ncbi:MAG: hypothetical protein K9H61_08495 [Bacteroidia bacterium]|nr:hypothetical protein [Bacteroidia bacterium]MCF8447020.1 hypothetical protein [Bacteroidia bacterium]
MRWRFILLLFLLNLGLVQAQTSDITYKRSILIQQDSFQLDSSVIIKGSVLVDNYVEGIDYRINYFYGAFINIKIPKNSLITLTYTPIRYPFKEKYQHKDTKIILPEFNQTVNPFSIQNEKGGFDPILKNEGLVTNGSIMRGLSIGNSQNAIVNANLNLQLAGKINNDVDILAAISDENNPIQPEGNTQELQDFDQVFVQFSKNKNKLVVGDYLMTKPQDSYFLNYYKKSRGLSAQTNFDLKNKQHLEVGAQAALARGRFVRNVINGLEGNQGPYRLVGPNGEVFIIIISGTEAVYLDGERLTRGEQNDYTIDYNSGEIVFMPKRLITQYSRIIIEFQYSDRNFARTLFALNTKWDIGKGKVYLNYYTEQDNKNQPFQQSLTDSNKLLLSQVGDDLQNAKVSSEVPVSPYDPKKILYRKIDTLGYSNVYFHTTDPNSATVFYELRFSFVGTQKGNYVQGASSTNGRVFNWVEPINGIPQGDFEPYIQLIAPNQRQMLNLGTEYKFNKNHQLNVEGARSINDKNLYSDLGKSNDAGYALKVNSTNTFQAFGSNSKLESKVSYEFTDENFRYIERYRNVEFNRIWNRQLNNQIASDSGNKEHLLNWILAYKTPKNGQVDYQFSYYNRGDGGFSGLRHQLGSNLYDSKNRLLGSFEWINGNDKDLSKVSIGSNLSQNFQLTYTRLFRLVQTGTTLKAERSSFKSAKDSLLNGSFAYEQIGFFIKSSDTTRFSWFANYNLRRDFLPQFNEFKEHTLANEAKFGIGYLQKNFNKLNVDISFRDFRILDTNFAQLKPEKTLLSRVEYDYGFFKRLITANSYLQLGSGNELRRDYQYVEVQVGQGAYVWKDFNGDEQQQLNEFQLASFADRNLANYIKVYLPTTSLIRVNNTQFSQTLNINTFQSPKRTGLLGFVYRFSDQAAARFERKVLIGTGQDWRNLLQVAVPDSNLVNLASTIRNTLFFNRNNPYWGLDWAWNKQETKNLQTNGFESRNRMENALGGRVNINANWTINGAYAWGLRQFNSEFFSQNNYQYQFEEIKPKVNFQWQQQFRISLNYTYSKSVNQIEKGGEKSEVNEMGAELRYSFAKIGVLTVKYSLYKVAFTGSTNSPLAYDMLQGLSLGNNQLWSVGLQQRFGQNLQINISYDGRKSGTIPVIHTGKMEARYLF